MLETQMDSYDQLVNSPLLGRRHREVMNLFKKHQSTGLTTFEVVKKLEWPVNSVSGRITELRAKGYLKASAQTRVNPDSGVAGVVWILGDVFTTFKDESSQP